MTKEQAARDMYDLDEDIWNCEKNIEKLEVKILMEDDPEKRADLIERQDWLKDRRDEYNKKRDELFEIAFGS